MKPRTALWLSALVYVVCAFGASRLARSSSDLAHFGAAVLIGAGILGTAALTPARTFSRRALLGAGTVLAGCMALPLAFVDEPAAWLRANPSLLGYFWLWMILLGLPYAGARAWCASPRTLLITSAVLGAGAVAAALW